MNYVKFSSLSIFFVQLIMFAVVLKLCG